MPDAGVAGAYGPLHRLDPLHRREAAEQLLEQHAKLEPRQVGAKAVVHALTEAQVWIGFTREVERIRDLDHRTVAVRRHLPHQYLLTGRDMVPAKRNRLRRGAPL